MTDVKTPPELGAERPSAPRIEAYGTDVIAESDRKGRPADLFWPWCAANISVFAVSFGSFVIGFGINLWQSLAAAVIGTVVGFLLVGFVSVAGKRGSAPTLVLSRAAFGTRGNLLPGVVSYLLLVGWETVLVALSTLATATVFSRLGWSSGTLTKVIAFLVVAGIIVLFGILGFDAIMRLQKWLTIITIVITALYIGLTVDHINMAAATKAPAGGWSAFIGALVLVVTGFGIGWVNSAADYSRYLPRRVSTAGVIGWPTFGASLPVGVLVVYGVFLSASDPKLAQQIGIDPIGALTNILPTWFLIPFVVVAVAGLVSGAVLDIYSSGLTLLAIGLPTPRWVAAAIDGVLMIAGAVYIVFFAGSFLPIFQAFLITLGVPIAAWCGVFLGDLVVRRKDYEEAKLFDANLPGGYRRARWDSVLVMLVATGLGWGLVIDTLNATPLLDWLGYLLGPLGLGGRDGAWAYASLGILVALVVGFVGYLPFGRRVVRRQEAQPAQPVV